MASMMVGVGGGASRGEHLNRWECVTSGVVGHSNGGSWQKDSSGDDCGSGR